MEESIRNAIERQAKKLLERDRRVQFTARKYERRYKLRTGETPVPSSHRSPLVWRAGCHFDPYYCIRHSKYLAKIIWRKILLREYQVEPAILYQIPKDSGGHRDIMVFSIVDAAIANLFNTRLRDRNRNILSSFCYSYRNDRGLFDAVLQLSSYLSAEKAYVIQYDFSKYFDSIKHDYIEFLLERKIFVVSPTESYIIGKFLNHPYARLPDFKKGINKKRTVGVPQGSSLSLFLSNIAAHELDKKLETMNGMFVRFADDIVCVAYNHNDALNIVEQFRAHCTYSGISINYDKSPGIKQLEPTANSDRRLAFANSGDIGRVRQISDFDYIGHKFPRRKVLMSSKGIARIKKRISKIVYIHLLHNPRGRKKFSQERVGGNFYDWDLVTCINEIRRYINGGLPERRITNFLDKNIRIHRFRGLMSFYPLVTAVDQFAALDGWLLSVLRRALRERARVLKNKFGIDSNPLSDQQILDGSWYEYQQGIDLETNAPSFVLAWRAARKSFKQYGLIDFEQPSYYSILTLGFDTYY